MKKVLLYSIKMYKKYFSRVGVCRFSPSCSIYMYESIEKHGSLKGIFLGTKRICKCNTLITPTSGKYDPVI